MEKLAEENAVVDLKEEISSLKMMEKKIVEDNINNETIEEEFPKAEKYLHRLLETLLHKKHVPWASVEIPITNAEVVDKLVNALKSLEFRQ